MEIVRGLLLWVRVVTSKSAQASCSRGIGGWRDDCRFGHAFNVDTGTSTGEINGHSKSINAVSIRQSRPCRAATAADDCAIIFHQGVLFSSSLIVFDAYIVVKDHLSNLTRCVSIRINLMSQVLMFCGFSSLKRIRNSSRISSFLLLVIYLLVLDLIRRFFCMMARQVRLLRRWPIARIRGRL